MSGRTPLQVDYWSPEELAAHGEGGPADILGLSIFCAADITACAGAVPVARVRMPPLGGRSAICEVWRAHGPFRTGKVGSVRYRCNHDFVFGCLELSEADAAAGDSAQAALPAITELAYGEIFRCLEVLGFPHLLRVWNHLPEINTEAGGLERYRRFNEARQRSFHASGRQVNGEVPAACALGSPPGTALVVYFLASSQAGKVIENPRQVPAWRYPAQYGAFSPLFSRAIVINAPTNPGLFVSGTASIVGHRTLHAGNAVDQTREAAANLCALLREANRAADRRVFATEQLRYKVYVRHPRDYDAVAETLHGILRPLVSPVFLRADICRTDLLVEVEAVGLRESRTARAAVA